jgi:hypothetical protein
MPYGAFAYRGPFPKVFRFLFRGVQWLYVLRFMWKEWPRNKT